MKTRRDIGFTLPQLLVVMTILGVLAAYLFPVLRQVQIKSYLTSSSGMAARQVSYGMIQYMQDNDQKFPRSGFDCIDHASDPALFKQGQQNQCGGNDWQDAIEPYVKSKAIFVSPFDQSSPGEGPWGGGTGTNLNTTDGNFSLLYNDLLSHKMPTKSGGYADPANQDKRANGLRLSDIKDPMECLMLAEGHGGWDRCSTQSPPLLVATDWTGSTDLQNKWHHDYTITGNYTGFMSAVDYSGVSTIRIGLPFYSESSRYDHRGGGDVAFVDGHVHYKQYSNSDGSPVLCKTLPWAQSMDPRQRNKKIDSCADPNNPVAAGWGGSNWF